LLTECSQQTGSTLFSFWSSCPETVEILWRTLFLSDCKGRGFFYTLILWTSRKMYGPKTTPKYQAV